MIRQDSVMNFPICPSDYGIMPEAPSGAAVFAVTASGTDIVLCDRIVVQQNGAVHGSKNIHCSTDDFGGNADAILGMRR